MQRMTINGQDFTYNPDDNLIRTMIQTTFKTAGKHFDWTWGEEEGVGINKHIVDYGLERGADIRIVVAELGKRFQINPNTIMREASLYATKNVDLLVIPISLMNELDR